MEMVSLIVKDYLEYFLKFECPIQFVYFQHCVQEEKEQK